MSDKYSGSEWIERQGKTLSPFGVEVADVVGQVYLGIYHIQKAVLHDRVEWGDDRFIRIVIPGGVETYDFNVLTRLVVLCHDRMIRLEINPVARDYLALCFTSRKSRTGNNFERMPYLEEHIKSIRESIGLPIKD
jgi:hypothetical protein